MPKRMVHDHWLFFTATFLALAGLFTASINVSNILLSRAMRRQKSVGILMALGSTRRNIFNLFFSEALIIGAIGAVLGTGFSLAVLPALNKFVTTRRLKCTVMTS